MFLNDNLKRNRFFILLVLLVTFLSFSPALTGDFTNWDDPSHLTENLSIRALDYEHIQRMFTERVNELYIPLTSFSFALEYHYFGLNPFVYHLNNLILHLSIVFLVFLFARRLGLTYFGASMAALIFGVHPMRAESVAWITERKDVLYAFFYMLSLLVYLRYIECKKDDQFWLRAGLFILILILGALSMLAKPMALSLPLIFVLIDWFKQRTINIRTLAEKLPLALIVVAITWVSYSTQARIPGDSFLQAILIWVWTLVFYVRQFVFPLLLIPIYELPQPVTLSNLEYLLSLTVFIVFIGALIYFRKKKYFIFSVLFFFFSIFFLLRYDSQRDINIVADRFMYLPNVGFCVLLGLGLERVMGLKKDSKLLVVKYLSALVFLGIITMFSFKSYALSKVWGNSVDLWKHQYKYVPNHGTGLNNLADAYLSLDDYKLAVERYQKIVKYQGQGLELDFNEDSIDSINKVTSVINIYKHALKVNPNYGRAYYNLAKLYKDLGLINESVRLYKQAVAVGPDFEDAYFGLGDLYKAMGTPEHAILAYEKNLSIHKKDENAYLNVIFAYNEALAKDPDNADYKAARLKAINQLTDLVNNQPPRATSFFNLGSVYAEIGETKRAQSAYEMALELNPQHGKSLYNLGNLHKNAGEYKKALMIYKRAASVDKRNSDIYLNIGIIYGYERNLKLALENYLKAIDINPSNEKAYFNTAYIYEVSGQFGKALEWYKKSIEIDPKNAESYYNLGNVYINMNMSEKAGDLFKKTVEIDVNHMDAWVNLSILAFRTKDYKNAVKYCDEAVLLGYDAPKEYLKALEAYR